MAGGSYRVRRLAAALVTVLASASLAPAKEPGPRIPEIRLVPVLDGLRWDAPEGDVDRTEETKVGALARKVGLDLEKPENPLLVARFDPAQGRLFYVFYKTTANAFGDRAWLLQRIQKTERTWKESGAPPEVAVTYQVEAFKLQAGALKGVDQHYGSFSLSGAARREIVKEYEIGFGDIEGTAEGAPWPFPIEALYRLAQPYQAEPGLYPKVKVHAARRWTLRVEFDAKGAWRVAAPELGVDAPKQWPKLEDAAPTPDPASKDVVLEPGTGLVGLVIGRSDADALRKALGEPLEDVPAGRDHRLLSFERSVTCNLDPQGRLKTVLTRPGFLGRTTQGVSHGMSRAKVLEAMGAPKQQDADAASWAYPGLLVAFDAYDRVTRFVVSKKP